jgi:cysteinyl-tRNA synthetase
MADKWLWDEAAPTLSANARAHPHQFDIHGGGIDLVFPHHENEIAQTRCAFHTPLMADYWMHNGFLQVEGEKMSKSAGNFVTIRELFDGWKERHWERPEIRLAMLMTLYSQPLDWTPQRLIEARAMTDDWKAKTANVLHDDIHIGPSVGLLEALCDDLNTHEAIRYMQGLSSDAAFNAERANELYANLVFLGLFSDRRFESQRAQYQIEEYLRDDQSLPPLPATFEPSNLAVQAYTSTINQRLEIITSQLDSSNNVFSTSTSVVSIFPFYQSSEGNYLGPWRKYGPSFVSSADMKEIEQRIGIGELNRQIEERLAARKSKNFEVSDRIRGELAKIGIELEDRKDQPTTWKYRRVGG